MDWIAEEIGLIKLWTKIKIWKELDKKKIEEKLIYRKSNVVFTPRVSFLPLGKRGAL